MNRDNAVAQNQNLPAAASGRMFPTAYTSGAPSYWLFRWGSGALTGTPDARFYFRTDGTTTTTVVYVDVNGTWTALTIN